MILYMVLGYILCFGLVLRQHQHSCQAILIGRTLVCDLINPLQFDELKEAFPCAIFVEVVGRNVLEGSSRWGLTNIFHWQGRIPNSSALYCPLSATIMYQTGSDLCYARGASLLPLVLNKIWCIFRDTVNNCFIAGNSERRTFHNRRFFVSGTWHI